MNITDNKKALIRWRIKALVDNTERIRTLFGGERGIRTLGRLAPTPDFESGTFNRSATSPFRSQNISTLRQKLKQKHNFIDI
jgi:hypothetical protein